MDTIDTIKSGIKSAKNLDELCEALTAAELHIQGRRDAGDDQACIADYCDVTSLPSFGGREPEYTTGIWSWDETRELTGIGEWIIEDRPLLKVRFSDYSDNPGWVVWTGKARGWQPIIECKDADTEPTLCEAESADMLTPMDGLYSDVEIVG